VGGWLVRSIYALADAQTALDHVVGMPAPDYLEPHAAALMRVGRFLEAIDVLEPAVMNPAAEGAPVPESTVMLLAGAYEQAGGVDRALAVVEDLYRRRPGYFGHLDALFVLAMLQSNNGRHADALNTLGRAEPFAPTATARAMVAASRALTSYDLGRRDDALDILMRVDLAEALTTDAPPSRTGWTASSTGSHRA
jgi:tetratricopeptide (TPR) repeat protein